MTRPLLLDASALMAFIRREPGGEAVLIVLTDGQRLRLVGVAQLVEVEGKLVSDGSFTPEQVWARLHQLSLLLDVQALQSGAQAASAFYYARRKLYGLGDALCLGLAEALRADVLTAERGRAAIPDVCPSPSLSSDPDRHQSNRASWRAQASLRLPTGFKPSRTLIARIRRPEFSPLRGCFAPFS